MWTWQFELNDILTTLTIVRIVTGVGNFYKTAPDNE